MNTIRPLRILLIMAWFTPAITSLGQTTGPATVDLQPLKKAVVFIGMKLPNGDALYGGTGCLFEHSNILFMVTARHVAFADSKQTLISTMHCLFLNKKNGGFETVSLSNLFDRGISWKFPANPAVDLAAIQIPIAKDTVDIAPLSIDALLEVGKERETDRIIIPTYLSGFSLTNQPGFSNRSIRPILRTGAISMVGEGGTIHLDAAVFGGNSGSPVFMAREPYTTGKDDSHVDGGNHGFAMIGLMSQNQTYWELKLGYTAEYNLGFSRAVAAKEIRAFLTQIAVEQHRTPE